MNEAYTRSLVQHEGSATSKRQRPQARAGPSRCLITRRFPVQHPHTFLLLTLTKRARLRRTLRRAACDPRGFGRIQGVSAGAQRCYGGAAVDSVGRRGRQEQERACLAVTRAAQVPLRRR